MVEKPTPSVAQSHSKKTEDWFDALTTIQEDHFAKFAMPPQEAKLEKYKGYGSYGFSEHKSEEIWRK